MKFIHIAALAILALPSSSYAGVAIKNCSDLHDFAADMMRDRQNNVPIPQIMDSIAKIKDAKSRRILVDLMRDAYAHTLYLSPEYQDRAVIDFANRKALECMR